MARRKMTFEEEQAYLEAEYEREEYYDRHPSDIPEGCRACGGPYPNCCDSCPMFDD